MTITNSLSATLYIDEIWALVFSQLDYAFGGDCFLLGTCIWGILFTCLKKLNEWFDFYQSLFQTKSYWMKSKIDTWNLNRCQTFLLFVTEKAFQYFTFWKILKKFWDDQSILASNCKLTVVDNVLCHIHFFILEWSLPLQKMN